MGDDWTLFAYVLNSLALKEMKLTGSLIKKYFSEK